MAQAIRRNPFGSQVNFYSCLDDEKQMVLIRRNPFGSQVNFYVNRQVFNDKSVEVAIPSEVRSISTVEFCEFCGAGDRRNPFGSQVNFYEDRIGKELKPEEIVAIPSEVRSISTFKSGAIKSGS